MTTVVEGARQALGPIGVYLPVPFTSLPSMAEQREAVQRLERAGYRTVWTNEVVGGKDVLVQLAVLMAATRRMTFGTGIANIWARAPQTMRGASALLAQAYPERLVLGVGVGVGYPFQAESVGREFGKPLATMRDYVERMSAPSMFPPPDVAYPLVIAANGPKMLGLAGDIADGAMPSGLLPASTAQARQVLGSGRLLVVGLSVTLDNDRDRAKETARKRLADTIGMIGMRSASVSFARFGYTPRDVEEVSDRLLHAVHAYGDPAAIAAKVREHLAEGADHVQVLLSSDDFAAGMDQLVGLASTLVEIS